jgi:hypothetical protein
MLCTTDRLHFTSTAAILILDLHVKGLSNASTEKAPPFCFSSKLRKAGMWGQQSDKVESRKKN